jgi:hypothetical protein
MSPTRAPDGQQVRAPKFVCAENTHEYYAGKDSAVPTADKPDF